MSIADMTTKSSEFVNYFHKCLSEFLDLNDVRSFNDYH